ncbi:MAG TPA: hypothetical protein VD862_00905 [Candidatus Paceibacterota bacterium]|nr:hypothetical protein [Candidatus Paceibacterota bacterium]
MDTSRLISRVLIYTAQVLTQVRDEHLRRTLHDAVDDMLRASLDGAALEEPAGILQECLEQCSAAGAAPLGSLLFAERHVLLLRLHLRSAPAIKAAPTVPAARPASRPPGPVSVAPVGNGHLTKTSKRVLARIKELGIGRPRDIIEKCRPLSDRTVKRSLRELVLAGLVRRDTQDGNVIYAPVRVPET